MSTTARHHRRARDLPLAVRVRHYESMDQVRWHVQLQVAAIDDPLFATPLIDARTDEDASDFRYRSDEHDAAGTTQPFDGAGELTTRSKASPASPGTLAEHRVGTAFYVGDAALERGRSYWVRSRQKPAGTTNWSEWATDLVSL